MASESTHFNIGIPNYRNELVLPKDTVYLLAENHAYKFIHITKNKERAAPKSQTTAAYKLELNILVLYYK